MKKNILIFICIVLFTKIYSNPFQKNIFDDEKEKHNQHSRKYKLLVGIDAGLSFPYTSISSTSNAYGKIAYEYKSNNFFGFTFGISHLKDTFVHKQTTNVYNTTLYSFNNLVYSTGLFYRVAVLEYLMFNIEPRLYYSKKVTGIKLHSSYDYSVISERKLVGGLVLGTGISHNTFLNIITNFYLNYDFMQNRYSPYYKRIDLRFGFMLPL